MKSFKEKIEAILNAGAFAEAGEYETALGFLRGAERNEETIYKTADRKRTRKPVEKTSIREKLQKHFMAAAFAEAGEFETAREILPAYERKQSVLLAIDGSIPARPAFDYAANLCARMNAELDILQILSRSCPDGRGPSEGLAALLPELREKGVPFNVTVKRAKAGDVFYDYVRIRKNVVTAVIDSPDLVDGEPEDTPWKETLQDVAERVSIPLVTVSPR
jgi:hypothetical protein